MTILFGKKSGKRRKATIVINRKQATDRLTEIVGDAFERAAKDVIRKARETGTNVVIWEDNKIKEVSPDQIAQEIREPEQT